MINRFPTLRQGKRVWVEATNMATDNGFHFPSVGQQFVDSGAARVGRVGDAQSLFFSTRELVGFAAGYFRRVLG